MREEDGLTRVDSCRIPVSGDRRLDALADEKYATIKRRQARDRESVDHYNIKLLDF